MITVRIEKESYGSFIARNEGKIIFTDYVLPGELCRLKLIEEKKDFAFAELVEVIEPSDKRIKPGCPNFMKCGGCDYLHTDYRTELEFKKNIITDSIKRIGRFDFSPEIKTYASERCGYRSRCSVKSNGNQTGFYGKKSNTVIPFPGQGCILLDDAIKEFIQNNRITKDCRISKDASGKVSNIYSADIIIEIDGPALNYISEGILYEKDWLQV